MNEQSNTSDHRVNATPAKRFFVSMLVKDIELAPAIIDLVDNTVDGAKRLRPEDGTNRYEGLQVSITVAPDRFVIEDNCGGIDVDHARNYAFRFGRPEEYHGPLGEVGQFGIGMKRALFKLGEQFRVESRTEHARFSLPVSVPSWMADDSPDWAFEFAEVEEDLDIPEEDRGTRIEVQDLYPWVAEEFADGRFESRLRAELELREMVPLQEGLAIDLNGADLSPAELTLLSSDEFSPIVTEQEIGAGSESLNMRLYAGLVRVSDQEDDVADDPGRFRGVSPAGWYLFCNDRLLLAHDKSRLTGWGDGAAAYHPQFRQFRGYVFLSGPARLMPWTTTKTAVDEDAPVFRQVQGAMFDALRKLHTVMNRLKAERQQQPENERPAVAAMQAAEPKPVTELTPSESFRLPPAPSQAPSPLRWIRYSVDRDDFDRVAVEVGNTSPSAVGRETFYFYLQEQVPD